MATWRYHKDRIGNHRLHPETLMLGYGYEPALSEGAVKAPVFLTSTFVFRSAEEGQDFFDYVSAAAPRPQETRPALSIHGSIIPTTRLSKIASRSSRKQRQASSFPAECPPSPRLCSHTYVRVT